MTGSDVATGECARRTQTSCEVTRDGAPLARLEEQVLDDDLGQVDHAG